MKKCRYCRRNPCTCGAADFYPEMMDELPRFDDPRTWMGVSGSSYYSDVSGSSYGQLVYYTQRPPSPPPMEIIK